MKVLITGGSGFVGSHLADRLLADGHQVLVVDNYETGRRDNLQPHDNLTVVEGTIVDRNLVDRLFDDFRPDKVAHAAASYKDPNNWTGDINTNVLGTANIVRAAQQVSVDRLVYFQTALCYGANPVEQPITLDHPIRPACSYAISKTAGEQYIESSGLDFISLRLANVYGPRNVSGPLPTFYQRLSSGKPCFVMDTRRDFVYVNDLIGVVMKALAGTAAAGAYHVSSGSDCSIKELFDATIAALDITLENDVEVRPRLPDDAYSILLDPGKTNQSFDWRASTPLETGVDAAVDYYRRHGVNETYTHLIQGDDAKAA